MNPVLRLALMVAIGVCALVVLLTGWRAWQQHVDFDVHLHYDRALRQAVAMDVQLDEQVAESRLGRVTHFDDLVTTWQQMSALHNAVGQPPNFLDESYQVALARQLRAYDHVLQAKGEWLEDFKTDEAVRRTAMHSLPFTVERVSKRLAGSDQRAEIESKLRAVLLAAASADPARELRAQCALGQLEGQQGGANCAGAPIDLAALSPVMVSELAAVAKHGRTALERQKKVGDLITKMKAEPTTEHLGVLANIYRVGHEKAAASALAVRFAWLVSGGLMLWLLAVSALLRARADAKALGLLSERLGDANEKLRIERDAEMKLAKLKDHFMSMTSHEFRHPLGIIHGSAQSLVRFNERWSASERQEFLDDILRSTADMKRLMEQVLLAMRGETELMDMRPTPVAVGILLAEIHAEVLAAQEQEREVRVELQGESGPIMLAPVLIRHVLINLLSNALKYSPADSTVFLNVQIAPGGVTLQVRDLGIGIPQVALDSLFEPFFRANNVGGVRGTGLGLAVVDHCVRRHGGHISVDSAEGQGTRFKVFLPSLGPVPEVQTTTVSEAS